ncbi:MAG: tetratricopeptide repeat-containing protein kinase family protein, partial [Acidobacteriota bacterium]
APTGDRFVGTPAYMSPEALEPGSELDTRSDVFSLGVLLYELLTGLDPWATSHADPVEIIRRRQNYDAERPSTQITDLDGEQREHIARRRQLDAGRLVHRLRGDLDSIVMKAIDSDPALRYESAAELADDIARHLADEPIRARPFTARVLVGKLVRRHRTAVIAASAVVLTLAIGVIGTVGGLLRARAAEQTARAEAAAAIAARDDADDAVHFLARIFDSANPLSHKARKRPEQVTALEILARGAERLDSDFEDSPLVKARLQEEIGRIYRRLGIFDEARKHLKASLANLESHGDPNSRDLADVQIQLAELEIRLANRETATFLLERALAILSAREESAREESAREEREDLRKRAEALDMLARVRRSGGDYGGAVEAQEQSMAIFRRLGGAVPALSAGHQNLGLTFSALGRWSAAEAEFRRAIELRKSVLKPGHPTFASHYNGLAMVIANQGRFEEAVEILVPLEAQLRSRLGDRHPKLANVLDNLGVQSVHLGRLEQAEAYLLEALEIRERTLGSEHPDTARSLDNLARVLEDLGRPGEARPMQERALAIREAALGAEHPDVARSLGHLARLAIGSRDFELAHRHAERAHRIRVTKLNSGHRDIGLSALDLGETLWHLERREEARRLFDEARALFAGGDESMRRDAEDAAARLAALGAR